MYKGTGGCVYNCGESCSGECNNREKIGILVSSALNNYESKLNTNEVLTKLRDELNEVLNHYISENWVVGKDFPIEFENDFGKWKINSDGTTHVQPKTGVQHIELNIIIKKTGEIDYE